MMLGFHLNDLIVHTRKEAIMRMQHQQKKLPSQRFELRRWMSRKFTTSFSNIDWGDDSSCEDVTPQTGGEEAGRNTIGSGSSDGTKKKKKKNHVFKFNSFTGSVINIKGIFAHRDEKSKKNDHESSTDKPTAATIGEETKQRRKQPLLQQHKSSSSTPAAAALVHPPTSSPLDESEISVDDDGFLHWDRTKRTFTQCPMINESVTK
jgi:hypothetical protein